MKKLKTDRLMRSSQGTRPEDLLKYMPASSYQLRLFFNLSPGQLNKLLTSLQQTGKAYKNSEDNLWYAIGTKQG